MECMQLRSPPGPFHYLISEQAKSLVALQNEVGALLEFRDLVIETFPNLRSKMAPSTPASGTRRDWEPGVRVRRKLAGGGGDARGKPQPSVQDSGFSTETSCGKDAAAPRARPLEDELWALLDVIQRKGGRLRDEAELLRAELDERADLTNHADHADLEGHGAEEEFSRALAAGCGQCVDARRLRAERDALEARSAQLQALLAAHTAAPPAPAPRTPLGRLDAALATPPRPPRVSTPDSTKFSAILLESNPVELQRQLLTATVNNQVLCEKLHRMATHRTQLLERLERARDLNDDLKFRLEEKNIEVEGARARLRQVEAERRADSAERRHSMRGDSVERRHSMRDLEPLALPDAEQRIADTPRRRPSRIPLHTAHKGLAPRPPAPAPPRPPSAHSARSASLRSRASAKDAKSSVPVRRSPPTDKAGDSWTLLAAEYVRRASRLAPLLSRPAPLLSRPAPLLSRPAPLLSRPLPADLAYHSPQNLALELERSILYEHASIDADRRSNPDSLWNGKPQQYFESMKYDQPIEDEGKEFDVDSLAP